MSPPGQASPGIPGDDPVEAGEISQIEYADLLLRHLGTVVGPELGLKSLRISDFCATVELEQAVDTIASSALHQSGDQTWDVPRTAAALESLLASASEPFPAVVPIVGGSLGTVMVMDARTMGTTPLSASLARRAARGHALAPWRTHLVSVSAVDGLDCQWELGDLERWIAGEDRTLWEDASPEHPPTGAVLFSPSEDSAAHRGGADGTTPRPPPPFPRTIEGIGPLTVVRCRMGAASTAPNQPRGIREVQPISVDDRNWVFVAGA